MMIWSAAAREGRSEQLLPDVHTFIEARLEHFNGSKIDARTFISNSNKIKMLLPRNSKRMKKSAQKSTQNPYPARTCAHIRGLKTEVN